MFYRDYLSYIPFSLEELLDILKDSPDRWSDLLGNPSDEVTHLVIAISLSYIAYWALVHYGDLRGHTYACPICKSPLLRTFKQNVKAPHHLHYVCINKHCPRKRIFTEEYSPRKDTEWLFKA